MGRGRYKIYEPTHPHFLTCTILNWLPIFTRKESRLSYAFPPRRDCERTLLNQS